MFLDNLDENTVYEVLIFTECGDNFSIKPFGMRYDGENILLKLYPNNTLFNIKKNNAFTIHFTTDVLLYTEAAFSLLDESSLKLMNCSVTCEVISYDTSKIEDDYGVNVITTIMAKPIKIIENKQLIPTINRATNKIIELLVDCSRYDYMDVQAKVEFKQKLASVEEFVEKNADEKHKKSIEIIKKGLEVNLHG